MKYERIRCGSDDIGALIEQMERKAYRPNTDKELERLKKLGIVKGGLDDALLSLGRQIERGDNRLNEMANYVSPEEFQILSAWKLVWTDGKYYFFTDMGTLTHEKLCYVV